MNTRKQINNYVARQAAWIKANNIKPGSKVLILRRHEHYSKGWHLLWDSSMTPGTIETIMDDPDFIDFGIRCHDRCWYPYTVLLPLDPNGDYQTKTFISGIDDKEYKCIVDMNTFATFGDFGLQDGYFLRKIVYNTIDQFTQKDMDTIASKYGYFIASQDMIADMSYPKKVIASELSIPWLPRIQY